MLLADVLNVKGEKVKEIQLAENIFNVPVKPNVLYEVITMQLANRRSGNASVKTRSEVSGSTRKLYRQKGTGRARRGDIKSPLLRGGGSIFGPKPRSFSYRTPKKVRSLALKMALSSKVQNKTIVILDKFELDKIKTSLFLQVAKALNTENALFVIDNENRNLELSSRNLQNVKVLRSEGLNVYDILKFKHLVLIENSIQSIERRLLG